MDNSHVGFGTDGMPLPSEQLIPVARGIAGNRLLLSFSGRDSLAAWLRLRDAGFEIIPYWCYTVPHLSFDDQMLEYYEREFGTHIIRLPHPYLYGLFHVGAWQPPENWNMLYWCELPHFRFWEIEQKLATQFGLGDSFLSAVGFRAADSLMRLRLIRQMGPIGLKRRRYYYAVWDWKTKDVKECIEHYGLKLSRAYLHFSATGDYWECWKLRYMKEHLPDDYQKVLEVFPLADLEIFRYEQVA